MDRIVIVGGSLAGLRAAETLRQRDFDGEVVIVGAEPHPPYDRPPLSKKLLAGEWEHDRIHLRPPDTIADLDVEWRFSTIATGLGLDERLLSLSDGSELGFDGLIIATGARPRRLPGQERAADIYELRTLDDALALRAGLLDGGRRLVVIGAGFIGLEAALTAHGLGNSVTVLEGASAPLVRGIGAEMGAIIGALHNETGVEIRCDVVVDGLADGAVRLGSGETVPADMILVGIGVEPATGWLTDSGLAIRDGVVCDETLLATAEDGRAQPAIYAAGDVARWHNTLFDEEMRVEHWTNAAEQGAQAAENLLAVDRGDEAAPYAPVPFVWSDQGSLRLQLLGRPHADDEVEIAAGSPSEGKFLALYHRDGRLRGALGVNAPRWVMPMRKALLEVASRDDALAVARNLASS
jgi:NADPH-dependent 2,4-dienoyl-CoA reductase/sulfur reductase-like enzyme